MKPWHDAIPALQAALEHHFPTSSPDSIKHFANEIYNGASSAKSLQWMERNDRRPDQDIADLTRAAECITAAAKKFRSVGWHGGKAVGGLAQKVHNMQNLFEGNAALSVQDSIETIAEFFDMIAEEIRCCAVSIDPSAGTIMSAFGEDQPAGKPKGRPKETAAYFAAREGHSAFRELSGKRPTVITLPHEFGNPAGGPFFDFLKDVFAALDVRASVETWARAVCKE